MEVPKPEPVIQTPSGVSGKREAFLGCNSSQKADVWKKVRHIICPAAETPAGSLQPTQSLGEATGYHLRNTELHFSYVKLGSEFSLYCPVYKLDLIYSYILSAQKLNFSQFHTKC